MKGCSQINTAAYLLDLLRLSQGTFSQSAAPVTSELTVKAAVITRSRYVSESFKKTTTLGHFFGGGDFDLRASFHALY